MNECDNDSDNDNDGYSHMLIWGGDANATKASLCHQPVHDVVKHKPCFTVLASLCVISLYVMSSSKAQALPHNFGLFMCYQYVWGMVL